MPRRLMVATLLCAVMSIPAVAQERVHLPAHGETDEWCITPIVWTGQDEKTDQQLRELASLQQRPYLGVELGDLTDAKAKELKLEGTKGALVERVVPGTPAESAGLKTDDVVVAIDGKLVASGSELRETLAGRQPGDKVSLEILRSGKRQTVEATLAGRFGDARIFSGPNGMELFRGRLPEGFEFGGPGTMMTFPTAPRLGVAVLPMTDDLRDYFGVERGKGVLVSAVTKGSPAAAAGIRAGDVLVAVDGETVTRSGDISRVLASKSAEGPRTVQVELVRDKSRQTVSATVEAPRVMNEE